MSEFLKEISQLIHNHIGYPIEQISLSSRLTEDIGFDGDDAWRFIEEFAIKYDVDMQDFEFYDYFGPDIASEISYFLWRLEMRFRQGKWLEHDKVVTVKKLVNAARQRRW